MTTSTPTTTIAKIKRLAALRNDLLARELLVALESVPDDSILFISNGGAGFPLIDGDTVDNRRFEGNLFRRLRPAENTRLLALCDECGLEIRVENCGLRNALFIIAGGGDSLEYRVCNKPASEVRAILQEYVIDDQQASDPKDAKPTSTEESVPPILYMILNRLSEQDGELKASDFQSTRQRFTIGDVARNERKYTTVMAALNTVYGDPDDPYPAWHVAFFDQPDVVDGKATGKDCTNPKFLKQFFSERFVNDVIMGFDEDIPF